MPTFESRTLTAFVPRVNRQYDNQLWFPRVFGKRQCESIIDLASRLPREDAMVAGRGGDASDQDTRVAGIAWMPTSGEFSWIFDKLARVVERANRAYQFDLIGFTEDAQFTCYDSPGAFYDWHQDGLEGDLAGRKLSLVVQLSDPSDYGGGDLSTFALASNPEVASAWSDDLRLQGSVTVFPAFEYHRVEPITWGKRFSLVCWVGGPPFR